MNLLTDPTFTLSSGTKVPLPGLFAAMASGQVTGYPSLRPHQRPAWHMFLVQLGALALRAMERDDPPPDAEFWLAALRSLTPDYPDDEPWRLAVDDRTKPAFLQPPAPDGLKWQDVKTPDALDMLITAKNHDLKQAVAERAAAEDWIFALVSLQTCEGYGGKGNNGIARMNGGSSSRPLLGLAPSVAGVMSVNPSAWWNRDMRRLISSRREKLQTKTRGPALLWCLDWPEGHQLDFRDIDPWFIEVCRRVRLTSTNTKIHAQRATSVAARIDAKALKGKTGDPWTPIHETDGKSLTLGSGDFDYKRICELLFSGKYTVPYLAKQSSRESGDMLLVAEAFSRGNCKTEGFKSRIISVPKHTAALLSPETPVATLAKAQMEEISGFDKAFAYALALMAAEGNRENVKKNYPYAEPARKRLNQTADRLFFPSLWCRFEAQTKGDDAIFNAKRRFLAYLLNKAKTELEIALPTMPCSTILRPRATVRARQAFFGRIRKAFPELFQKETTNAEA